MTVFSDPRAIDAPDLLEPNRFVILGMSQPARILFVVKTRHPAETSMDRYDWSKATRGRFAKRFRAAHTPS